MNPQWQRISRLCKPFHHKFINSLSQPRITQETVLSDILRHNASSVFGFEHRFSGIRNVDDYRARVPIHGYQDFENDIRAIANGDDNLLYHESTQAFEITSGSSGAAKLIPVTNNSIRMMQNALFAWLDDIVTQYPDIANGKMYWSISPQTRSKSKTSAGIPIGLDSDLSYFGSALARDIAPQIITIDSKLHNNDIDKWRLVTAFQLLCADKISLISVWSPTFILELFRYIEANADELIELIASGHHVDNIRFSDPKPARAKQLRQALSSKHIAVNQIWPNFQMLSCWTHGSSARFMEQLLVYFPAEQIQGKGLLASEGVVSIPLLRAEDPVLALSSGFYEFVDAADNCYLSDELELGKEYRVIATYGNGLYRYDSGDHVSVSGFIDQTPMLRFIGRSSLNSDLCGEKLCDAFVATQLRSVNGFAMLAPQLKPRPGYVLYLDKKCYDPSSAAAVTTNIENSLRLNPQYDYARQLNQLDELSFALVANPHERYIKTELARGINLGDIKPPNLRAETDWNDYLCARLKSR